MKSRKKRFNHSNGFNINTGIMKNKMELWNQVKLYQLREDDERFEIILLTIKTYASRNNAALFYNRKYLNWISISRQSNLALKLKENDFFDGNCKYSRKLYDTTCLSAAKDLDTGFDTKNVNRNLIADVASSIIIYDDKGIVLMTILEDNNVQVQAWYITIHYKYLDAQQVSHWITFRRRTVKVRNRRYDHRQNKCQVLLHCLLTQAQIFQVNISSSRYLFLIFVTTNHQIKDWVVVL